MAQDRAAPCIVPSAPSPHERQRAIGLFDGEELRETFAQDTAFGLAFTLRLLGVVSERLAATRTQLLDLYAPESKRAGT